MNTQPGQQAFHEVVSYSQKDADNVDFSSYASSSRRSHTSEPLHLHSHPHVPPQPQRTYSSISGFNQNAYSLHYSSYPMHSDTRRYSEASHDEDDRSSQEYTSRVDNPPVGSHPHSSSHDRVYPMRRFPPSSESSRYRSDHDTLSPPNVESLPFDDRHRSQEQHSRSQSPLGYYSTTLRGYHTSQSDSRQDVPQDDYDRGSLSDRETAYAYSQPETMSYTSPRRLSDTSNISQPQHPHLSTHSRDPRNVEDVADAPPSFLNVDLVSSIPMSNNPPSSRHFYHNHASHHGYEHTQQNLRQEQAHSNIHYSHTYHDHPNHQQSRHISEITSSAIAPSLSRSYLNFNPTERGNVSESSISSISSPLDLHRSHPPRSQSTSDSYTGHHYDEPASSYRISSFPSPSRSPSQLSDLEYDFASKIVPSRNKAEFDRNVDALPRYSVPGQEDDQILLRTKSARTGIGPSEHMAISVRHNLDSVFVPEEQVMIAGAVKKKKKSKMHECEICHKKFPRPSGLKTHMNTHSHEKPYPCGFPGCSRTFGVRSNARRHLRTHGVIAVPAPPPPRKEIPYIVGFDTPTILPPQNTARTAQMPQLHRVGNDGKGIDEGGYPDYARTQESREEQSAPSTRAPPFKVRWMPLSMDTHTERVEMRVPEDMEQMHATRDQDNARKGKERWQGDNIGEYNDDDEEPARLRPRLRLEIDGEPEDENEDDIYGDRAPVTRLNLRLRPNMLSSSQHLPSSFVSSGSSVDNASASGSNTMISSIVEPVPDATASPFGRSNRRAMSNLPSQSSSSFGFSKPGVETCRCSPPCRADSSGVVNCRLQAPIYPVSISPSTSAHSLGTPSPGSSTSPINLPSGYIFAGEYQSFHSRSSNSNIEQSGALRYNERGPYVQEPRSSQHDNNNKQ